MIDIKIDPEFKRIIPPLTDEEYSQLEENIIKDGCIDPLILWGDIIIDGHNRYEICTENNIPFKTTQKEFRSRDEAINWIILNQFGRRNISAYQRAKLALELKPIIAEKAKKNLVTHTESGYQGCQKSDKAVIDTKKELAKIAGVSHDTIAKVEKIEKKAAPEVRKQLDKGEISINQAYKAIKAEEKKEKAVEKQERKSNYTIEKKIPEGYCRLYTGDVSGDLKMIEDESVDFIITDPPYPKEYLSLYSDLSKLAKRVLKPGGSLIVMCGQSYLPEVIERLSENMQYHWCLTYLTPGGQSPQLFHKRVNTFWKPVLWLVKGKYTRDYIGDVLKSAVNDNDKRFHEWGQSFSGMFDIVERFTDPNDVILDPFMGGGTTGVVAVTTGRKFIGVDIDSKNVKISEDRIRKGYLDARS